MIEGGAGFLESAESIPSSNFEVMVDSILAICSLLTPLPLVTWGLARGAAAPLGFARGIVFYLAIDAGLGTFLGAVGGATRIGFLVGKSLVLVVGSLLIVWHRSESGERGPRTSPGKWVSAAFALCGVPFAVAAWLALSTPVTNFDALAYHLPTLAHWVQSGSLSAVPYLGMQRCYPMGMLSISLPVAGLGHSDVYAVFLSLLAAPLLGASVFLIARGSGADRGIALTSVACLLSLPVLVMGYESGRPDLLLAALFVYCVAEWEAYGRDRDRGSLLALGLGIVLLPTLKSSGLGYAALISIWIGLSLRGRRSVLDRMVSELRRPAGMVAVLLGLGLALFWYLRAQILCGSPFGGVGGSELGAGPIEMGSQWTAMLLFRTTLVGTLDLANAVDRELVGQIGSRALGWPFLAFLVFGIVNGALSRSKSHGHRGRSHLLWLSAITLGLYLITPFSGDNGTHGYRISLWTASAVRYALPFLAVFTAFVASRIRPGNGARGCALLLATLSVGWGLHQALALFWFDVGGVLILSVVATWAMSRVPFSRRWFQTALPIGIALGGGLVLLALPLRESRWPRAYGPFFDRVQNQVPPGEIIAFQGVDRPYPMYGTRMSRQIEGRPNPGADRALWRRDAQVWEQSSRRWLRDLEVREVRYMVTRTRDPRPDFDGRAADWARLLQKEPGWIPVIESGDAAHFVLFERQREEGP